MFLLCLVFFLVSCGESSEENEANNISLEGKDLLCLRDEKNDKFYAASTTGVENRYVYMTIKAYDTKEECEEILKQIT